VSLIDLYPKYSDENFEVSYKIDNIFQIQNFWDWLKHFVGFTQTPSSRTKHILCDFSIFFFRMCLSKLNFRWFSAHKEKIRNTDRGCRLWEVKNSGCRNSSPTEVKRTFIHQNLSIFIAKSMRNFCQTKSSPQNQRTYIEALELFISNVCSVHFPFVAILWNFLCQKSGFIWQDERSCFFPTFSVCVIFFRSLWVLEQFFLRKFPETSVEFSKSSVDF
jgi:hypothetical protein